MRIKYKGIGQVFYRRLFFVTDYSVGTVSFNGVPYLWAKNRFGRQLYLPLNGQTCFILVKGLGQGASAK